MNEKLFENMNVCILEGKIVSEVEFDFVYNSKKHASIANFIIETNDKNCSKRYGKYYNRVYAYDSVADRLYEKFEKGDRITIIGRVESSGIQIIDLI